MDGQQNKFNIINIYTVTRYCTYHHPESTVEMQTFPEKEQDEGCENENYCSLLFNKTNLITLHWSLILTFISSNTDYTLVMYNNLHKRVSLIFFFQFLIPTSTLQQYISTHYRYFFSGTSGVTLITCDSVVISML